MGECRDVVRMALLMGLFSLAAPGQGRRPRESLVSPQVQPNRRVTFQLRAPQAKTVVLEGSFLSRPRPMTRDPNGPWATTVGPLEPEIYEYNFVVDGLKIPDPLNPDVKVWRRRSRSMVLVPGQGPAFFEERAVPHGTVHIHRYPSKSLGLTRGLYVYTPPGYEVSPETEYPALYLFHGSGDTELTWTVVGRANVILDNAIAQGRARPMIVVMPYGHTPTAVSNRSSDRRHAAFETDLIEAVMPYVRRNYRVSGDRESTAVAGLSMGGGQALQIGLSHPTVFAWVGAFSSSVPSEAMLDRLLAKPHLLNEQLRLFWVGCGREDFLFQANERLVTELKTRGVDHVARFTAGAHEWRLWRRYLNELLGLLFHADR